MNKITFYAENYDKCLPVVPAVKDREWFDKSNDRMLYNDITLTMANQSGWEFRVPEDFEIEWNGGNKSDDLVVHCLSSEVFRFYTGMGNGICSIRAGYVVRTPPDYAILCTGAPNFFKDGAVTMTSLIESNWAHVTFFVNWKMTRPGKVKFKKDEPLGFCTIIPHRQLDNFSLQIDSLKSNPDLYQKYTLWQNYSDNRDTYKMGIDDCLTDEKTTEFHITKRKLKQPKVSKKMLTNINKVADNKENENG